jgi:hypothetical protein
VFFRRELIMDENQLKSMIERELANPDYTAALQGFRIFRVTEGEEDQLFDWLILRQVAAPLYTPASEIADKWRRRVFGLIIKANEINPANWRAYRPAVGRLTHEHQDRIAEVERILSEEPERIWGSQWQLAQRVRTKVTEDLWEIENKIPQRLANQYPGVRRADIQAEDVSQQMQEFFWDEVRKYTKDKLSGMITEAKRIAPEGAVLTIMMKARIRPWYWKKWREEEVLKGEEEYRAALELTPDELPIWTRPRVGEWGPGEILSPLVPKQAEKVREILERADKERQDDVEEYITASFLSEWKEILDEAVQEGVIKADDAGLLFDLEIGQGYKEIATERYGRSDERTEARLRQQARRSRLNVKEWLRERIQQA